MHVESICYAKANGVAALIVEAKVKIVISINRAKIPPRILLKPTGTVSRIIVTL